MKQLLRIVVIMVSSEFVGHLHDSDGCALSKDEGSDYDGYDSPNCENRPAGTSRERPAVEVMRLHCESSVSP